MSGLKIKPHRPTKKIAYVAIIAIVIVAFIIAFNPTLLKPERQSTSTKDINAFLDWVNLREVYGSGYFATVDAQFKVYNANPDPITVTKISFGLYADGVEVGRWLIDNAPIPVVISAYGNSVIKITDLRFSQPPESFYGPVVVDQVWSNIVEEKARWTSEGVITVILPSGTYDINFGEIKTSVQREEGSVAMTPRWRSEAS